MINDHDNVRSLCIGLGFHVMFLCSVALTVPPTFANQALIDHDLVEFQSGQGIGPRRAADIVQASIAGKVLSVSSGTHKGRPIYRVKVLLAGGRVKVIRVSAESGQLLN